MTSPTTPVRDPWEVVRYEAGMFFDLCRLMDDESIRKGNRLVANAVCESACLHLRVLVDVLLSKGTGKDDIRLNQIVPGFVPPSVEKLRAEYGNSKKDHSPCWRLNKMIAHATTKRESGGDYADVILKLYPVIDAVLSEVETHLRVLASRHRAVVSDVLKSAIEPSVNIHAKTTTY
jgi:hypothetical protein